MTVAGEPEFLDREQVERAVNALNQYVVEQRKTSLMSAIDEVEPIQLQFSVKKIHPEEQRVKVVLPHSLAHTMSDICLIVKDGTRKNERDYNPTIKHYNKLLTQQGVQCVSQIIPLQQIKMEYKAYEAKRNLSNMYETFLADSAIMRLLPVLLGKAFYRRKRMPVPVNMNAVDLKKEFNKALNLSYCVLNGNGPSGLMKVAHSGLSTQDSVENIMTSVEEMCKSLAGGAINIRNIHIKTADSPALLVYLSEERADNVKLPPRRKRKLDEDEPEEVTTVMEGKVKVTADGKVRVITDEALEAAKSAKDAGGDASATPKRKNRSTSKRNAARKRTAEIKKKKGGKSPTKKQGGKHPAVKNTSGDKNSKRHARRRGKGQKGEEISVKTEADDPTNAGAEMSEKEREILEERRSRELDADLFSDTTADSELSDVDEPTPVGKSVEKNNPKSGTNKKGGKGKPKSPKNVKAKENTTKAKPAKKARYF